MGFRVTFTLKDAYKRTTTRRFQNTRAAIADAVTDTTAMVGYLEALSNCAVVKTEITAEEVLATSPEEMANIDAGATIHARLNNGKLYPIHIPAVESALVLDNGDLDLADEALTNLETALSAAGHWTISEGDVVTDFEGGELDR